MSPRACRAELLEGLLRFLWRQWAQLGVSGDVPFRDRWVIDPEALLLGTLRLGRYDPRLLDEALDWGARHGRWLSVQRLKTLARAAGDEERAEGDPAGGGLLRRSLGGAAAVLASRDVRPRWRALLEPTVAGPPEPFFLGLDGAPLPIWGEQDPDFARCGLLRPPVSLRGLTGPIPMDAPACLLLRLRALFGLSPRAEAAAYLLARGTASAAEVARAARFTPPAAREALAELAQGGFAQGPLRGAYALDIGRWRAFLGLARSPVWVDWARALPALAGAVDVLAGGDAAGGSAYLRASALRRLDARLGRDLAGTGLLNPFQVPVRLEDAEETVSERLCVLAGALNQEGLVD